MSITHSDVRAQSPAGGDGGRSLEGRHRLPRLLLALAWVALVVVGYLSPQIFGGSDRTYSTFVLIAIFAVMAYGIDIVISYLGEVSLGHTLFWAGGAYVTAVFAVKYDWPPLACLVAALVFCAALALVLGLVTIRTREFVFSLVTYAAAIIGVTIVSNNVFLGGSDGLVGLPFLDLPVAGGSYTARTNADFWPIAFACLVLVVLLIGRFRRSRLGSSALMAQMNPALATTLGVDVRRVRVLVFVLSAPVAGLAGWLYAYQRSYVSPDLLSPYFLLFMLTAVILPGRRQLLGPLVGAALLTVQVEQFSFGGNADKIVLGGVLAAVLLLSPDGLAGLGRGGLKLLRRPGRSGSTTDQAPDRAPVARA